jgi:hypothetical protein
MENRLLLAAAVVVTAVAGALVFAVSGSGTANSPSFLDHLAATASLTVSTSPSAGPGANDQNPYGVAVVPPDFPSGGLLSPGDILVSNFNNATNVQGTGTTIVAVSSSGEQSTFFAAPASLPVGLTTALLALRSGLVVVGSTPTDSNGLAQQGSLLFIDPQGNLVATLADPTLLDGPWDMTADESRPHDPILYVSNVLSGTVTRLNLHVDLGGGGPVLIVESLTQIGSGFAHRTDPAALVVGPTGLVLEGDNLYVADTGNNRIQVLNGVQSTLGDLGAGATVVSGSPLQGPLALTETPIGTLVASNGDAVNPTPNEQNLVVEINPRTNSFVATRQLDPGQPGGIFGVSVATVAGTPSLIYANDNTSTVNVIPHS